MPFIESHPAAALLSTDDLAARIQFTNVKPDATRNEIVTHLETSARYRFHAAMISMCWVPLAREVLAGTGVRIATCIGLGLGHESLSGKAMLIRECLALGADEVDYEPNMGFLLSGMYAEFRAEAAAVTQAAAGRPLKAMLELGYLKTETEVPVAVQLLEEAGVPWVKNSSGWGSGSVPATPQNIRLLRSCAGPHTHVKASGKINSYEVAISLLEAGAELLGTSSGVQIVEHTQSAIGQY